MALAPGTRLGSYEILSLIGAGGMGEVYRARDPRLDRDVAIKVLPAAFSADRDRLHRFELEARAAAALNHPNILTVHEIGTHEGAPFVVSELLEGTTLREAVGAPIARTTESSARREGTAAGAAARSARLPALPLRKAIDYAIQIANGLAAAHEKGIVHRDVKPENLFVTRDGRVKILDFGLAKLREGDAASGAGATMLATRSFDTGAGVVLGTAGYMSPEQVRGLPVDHRSDIFSFGAVLYEMLAGTRAFRGETAADTISAILANDPPELTVENAHVPPALDRIVRHCLEKMPEQRFQAARDIVFNLDALSTASASAVVPAPAPPRPRRAVYLAVAAAAVAALAVAGTWRLATASREIAIFRQVTFRHGDLNNARFTADGQNIVYTAAWEGAKPEIFTVSATQSGGRPLDIKNAILLAVAKSGELAVSLAPASDISNFMAVGTLARGSMTGGAPKAEIENVVAADFTPDGKSLAIVRYVRDQRTCQLEYPIGTVRFRNGYLSDVRFSPDGKYLAFIEHVSASDDRGNAVILRATGEKVATGPIRDSHRGLVWSPSGDEIWVTSPLYDGSLLAVDLEGGTRELLNVPGRLFVRDVLPDGRVLLDQGAVRRGIVAVLDHGATQRDLSWLDYSFVRAISKDGQMIVFEEEGKAVNGYRTFVRNVDGSPAIEVGTGYGVAISDDKAWTLSLRFVGDTRELWVQPVGAGQPRQMSPPGWIGTPQAQFFPDGKRIVFVAREPERRPRTYVQALDGSAPRAISEEGVTGALVSPDQKWIAATSPAGPVLVSVEGGAVQPIRGAQPRDLGRGWTSTGDLYVANPSPTVLRIDTLNPWTGKRTLWKELRAPGMVGVRPALPFITPDGRAYVYGYGLGFSDLFVMTGVR
jgi:Tol biopolymer transport system component